MKVRESFEELGYECGQPTHAWLEQGRAYPPDREAELQKTLLGQANFGRNHLKIAIKSNFLMGL